MLRLAFTFILLLLLFVGSAVWLLDISPESLVEQREEKERSKPQDGASTAKSTVDGLKEALAAPPPPAGSGPSFDIARIDPNGTSVFAGRGEPRSLVTITADGQEIGTAAVDENGEWTLSTDAKIANPDAKLALFKAAPGAVARVVGAEPERKAAVARPQTAGAVASSMLKSLEDMVAAARTGEDRIAGAKVPAAAPPAAVSETAPSTAVLRPNDPTVTASTSVPVPITFLYNEATLTGDGRRAAALLLEYLQLKRFPKVTLTGHADERGSDELNMNLSRERLETVAGVLREGGYKGQLELIPKGKSEPFRGVVRSNFGQEDLWQLDRRVELVVTR